MRCCFFALVLLTALTGVAWAGNQPTGVLPVVGAQSQTLNPSLGRAVAELGQQEVLGPVEVQARLAAEPDLAAKLQRARESIALAREYELQMKRDDATQAAADAIRKLFAARAQYHAPDLVARAFATLALTQLLHPTDPRRARQAFRRALSFYPSYRPAPGQIPPRAAEMLDKERARAPAAQPPSSADLAWLAQRLKVTRLVWLRIEPGGKATVITYKKDREPPTRTVTQTVGLDRPLPATARVISDALGGPTRPALVPTTQSTTQPTTKTTKSPWYRKWWVWTIAGAVVAGAAVGIGVALTREESTASSHYDFHFHF